jgi:predicted dithiol-disulfide oxidoreductase (DUF899 family)
MTAHDVRFPGESDEYRAARDRLLQAEVELRAHIEAVAAQRRELPLGGAVPADYVFQEWHSGGPREIRLSELFAPGSDTLLLYSFMWVPRSQGLSFVGPCPSCTSIIDGIDGTLPHLTQRISFAVTAKAPIEPFRSHGEARGWRHARLLSAVPSSYNRDYGTEDAEGNQGAMATVFQRREGRIHHFWSSELFFVEREPTHGPRHVDFMWPVWPILDRTPDGRGGEWEPSLEYREGSLPG